MTAAVSAVQAVLEVLDMHCVSVEIKINVVRVEDELYDIEAMLGLGNVDYGVHFTTGLDVDADNVYNDIYNVLLGYFT